MGNDRSDDDKLLTWCRLHDKADFVGGRPIDGTIAIIGEFIVTGFTLAEMVADAAHVVKKMRPRKWRRHFPSVVAVISWPNNKAADLNTLPVLGTLNNDKPGVGSMYVFFDLTDVEPIDQLPSISIVDQARFALSDLTGKPLGLWRQL